MVMKTMGFYDLPKDDRKRLVKKMEEEIVYAMEKGHAEKIRRYASDNDTYIRKNAYLIIGRLYRDHSDLRTKILAALEGLFSDGDANVRQTVVYAEKRIQNLH
jgi:vesicle coat complex subunit